MTQDKGLDEAVADKIGEYVKLKGTSASDVSLPFHVLNSSTSGGVELVERLKQDPVLLKNKTAIAGLDDMALLFKYLEIYGVTDRVRLFFASVDGGWICD